jgi:hypothetical protein
LAAISAVFTITYVAKMLGVDEDWLHELSIDMFPEDGLLHVYGVGDDGVTAFTEYGTECLKQIIADERGGRNGVTVDQIDGIGRCGIHRMLTDRLALEEMLAPNPPNRLHCQHSPTARFESKRAAHQA